MGGYNVAFDMHGMCSGILHIIKHALSLSNDIVVFNVIFLPFFLDYTYSTS